MRNLRALDRKEMLRRANKFAHQAFKDQAFPGAYHEMRKGVDICWSEYIRESMKMRRKVLLRAHEFAKQSCTDRALLQGFSFETVAEYEGLRVLLEAGRICLWAYIASQKGLEV